MRTAHVWKALTWAVSCKGGPTRNWTPGLFILWVLGGLGVGCLKIGDSHSSKMFQRNSCELFVFCCICNLHDMGY